MTDAGTDRSKPTDRGRDHSSPEPRSFLDLLSDRIFGSFFYANALSNVGNWFQNVAAGIVVYDLTGSNTAVATVSVLQFAATMLLTPWMGALTDRVNRQRMLLVGQSIAFAGAVSLAVVVFGLGIEGLPGVWPIFAATAVIGLGAAIILPSLQTVVPALVDQRDLDRAITLNSMTFNIARGIGPIAAGSVIAAFGARWAFGINALTYLPLLVVLLVISPRQSVEPEPSEDGTVVDDVTEGFGWIRTHRPVVLALVATLIVGWTSDPFSTLMPALAASLGGGEATVGLLVGTFGLGAAITAPLSDRIRRRVGRERYVPVGLLVVGAGLTGVALAPVTGLALVGSAVTGGGFLLGVTGTNTELQRAVPDELRGRVMAWWSVAFLGCRPAAAAVDGLIADLTDVRVAVLGAAAVALAGGATFWRTGLTAQTSD